MRSLKSRMGSIEPPKIPTVQYFRFWSRAPQFTDEKVFYGY